MTMHFLREIDRLKNQVLEVSALVEENLRRAVRAIEERDGDIARKVIETDVSIDEREVEVEEEGLKILALHQPVAIDLRFIISALKINNDLERIGDLAVNIAERALFLSSQPKADLSFDFTLMAEKVQNMLKRSLDALVNLDADIAREVCVADDDVDEMNKDMYDRVKEAMNALPDKSVESINVLIHLLQVSRHLERVADHATNIAEDLIYMIEGRIVRHHSESWG